MNISLTLWGIVFGLGAALWLSCLLDDDDNYYV